MAEGRCGDCKHWKEPDGWFGKDLTLSYDAKESAEQRKARYAEQERINTLYRPCAKIDLQDEDVDPNGLPLAYTMDGSRYRADLYTRAEFGCALFEPKDATDPFNDACALGNHISSEGRCVRCGKPI